jgi:hypothetical protein
MGERTGKARLLNILSFFGSCESPPQDLTTVDGTSIWAGDGVHLTSNASRVNARKLMADLPEAAKKANQPPREQDWSQSYQPLHLPRKRLRQWGSRCLRRPDPARRHRRSGSLASCRCPCVGADPVTKTLPRGGGGTGAWQHARRQPWGQPWTERAAQRRPARPLGPLVEISI